MPKDESLPEPLPSEPLGLLLAWYQQAIGAALQPNPDSMLLATATPEGRPSARVVLCKAIDAQAGELVFYTNLRSRKARELADNPFGAGVFHWDHAGRQARVEGPVRPAGTEESDAYFASRPLVSRIGAWASEQGRPLASRAELQERVAAAIDRLGLSLAQVLSGDPGAVVPRPGWWGGYRLSVQRAELWVSGEGRLHDRAEWVRSPDGTWAATRLQP